MQIYVRYNHKHKNRTNVLKRYSNSLYWQYKDCKTDIDNWYIQTHRFRNSIMWKFNSDWNSR